MASSSKGRAPAELELEDFALGGLEAQLAALAHQPGFEAMAERIRREGYADGEAAARSAAEETLRQHYEDQLAKLSGLFEELGAARAKFMQENAEELLRLAAALARRVLRAEPRADAQLLAARLKECLRQLENESAYLIRVNPESAQALSQVLTTAGRDFFDTTPWRIVADRRIPAGSLVLEGEQALIESICEDELQRLEDALIARNREEPGGDGA